MILSYGNKETEQFANGYFVKKFQGFAQQAETRLAILEAAVSLQTLRNLRGNRFKSLGADRIGADRKGEYSIRINDQWRICFKWPNRAPGPSEVKIEDYH